MDFAEPKHSLAQGAELGVGLQKFSFQPTVEFYQHFTSCFWENVLFHKLQSQTVMASLLF